MLIFEKKYIYIHIPKNSGKFIRKKIEKDKNVNILQSYWGGKTTLDEAHIPYILKDNFVRDSDNYLFFSHSRNPYNRIISAYFYKNKNKNIHDFKSFIINELPNLDFDLYFDRKIIHYYPQYLFVCDNNYEINNVEVTKLEDIENPKEYKLTKYLDSDMIKIINEVYKKDFELFNYDLIKH